MRVFIAQLATETNTFAPFPTGALAVAEYGPVRDASRVSSAHPSPVLATWRRLAEAAGDETIESLSAFAQPAGVTVRRVYEALRDEIVADLRTAQQIAPLHSVLLNLHGAMVAEGIDDCEGDLLAHVRRVVPDAVVGIELDLHCHLTQAMLRLADLVIAVKEYPHIDGAERAVELFELCRRLALGEIAPVAVMVDMRMVGVYPTFDEPMKSIVAALRDVEVQPGLLSASIAHGFPWADVADVGTRVLVYADGDAQTSTVQARQIAQRLYAQREALLPRYPDIATALDQAAALPGLTVLADSSDNPGGGAPGDSTFFLRALLERQAQATAVGCFFDPGVAVLCAEAGVGARLPVRLGGKHGPMSGDPIDLTVEVLGVTPHHSQPSLGARRQLGLSVGLRCGGIHIAVCSLRTQTFSPEAFTGVGIALHDKRCVVVKSSSHFAAEFGPIAQQIIRVATPGTLDLNFADLPYTKRDGHYHPRIDDPWALDGEPPAQTFRRR